MSAPPFHGASRRRASTPGGSLSCPPLTLVDDGGQASAESARRRPGPPAVGQELHLEARAGYGPPAVEQVVIAKDQHAPTGARAQIEHQAPIIPRVRMRDVTAADDSVCRPHASSPFAQQGGVHPDDVAEPPVEAGDGSRIAEVKVRPQPGSRRLDIEDRDPMRSWARRRWSTLLGGTRSPGRGSPCTSCIAGALAPLVPQETLDVDRSALVAFRPGLCASRVDGVSEGADDQAPTLVRAVAAGCERGSLDPVKGPFPASACLGSVNAAAPVGSLVLWDNTPQFRRSLPRGLRAGRGDCGEHRGPAPDE